MLDSFDIATRMVLAVLGGAILGWERESQRKPAGLRTHMLVSLGAAGFMLAGLKLQEELAAANHISGADLMKVIAGIVGGVGFLGAGSIIRAGGAVHGLTTAASIWLAAAIGIACGLGYYGLAATSVLLTMVILLALGLLERMFLPPPPGEEKANQGEDQ